MPPEENTSTAPVVPAAADATPPVAADTGTVLTNESAATGEPGTGDIPVVTQETGEGDGQGKPAEGTPPGEAAGEGASSGPPETYAAFTLPEGIEMSPEYLAEMTPVFKELGLTQEAAQKLIDTHVKNVQQSEGERVNAFNQLTKNWLQAAQTDKEIGGEDFDKNVQAARVALQKFGTPALTELLRDFGIGNHPEIIRAFTRIGKLLKEDSPGQLMAPIQPQKKDRASILYPDSN